MRCIISVAVLSLAAAAASAQTPYGGNPWGVTGGYGGYGGYGNYGGGMPVGGAGAFRGANPPLSPYLNLLNGGNPATTYYNFVRPNLYSPFRGGGFNPFAAGGPQSMFPTLRDLDEDDLPKSEIYKLKKEGKEDEERVRMAPTGHAAAFGNTMGYYGPLMASQGGVGSSGTHKASQPTGMPSTGRR